jgi:putative nucleotidyltransferase with HDIG domain
MRLAELIGTLSLATDAGTGMPDSHALRSATVAVRLAEVAGESEAVGRDAFYLALLAYAGCTAESAAAAQVFRDEVAFGTDTFGLDWGAMGDMLPAMLRAARRGHGPIGGMVAMARAMAAMGAMMEVGRAHCEVALQLADRFGFDEAFRAALYQAFERWNGGGKPDKVKGEAIALPMRIAHVAVDANIGHRLGGVEGAAARLRKLAGKGLDPRIAEIAASQAAAVCEPLDAGSPWAAALAAEPAPHRTVDGDALDEGLRAIGHFADMKSRFTFGHSSQVSERAGAAAEKLGLAEATLLRRAGFVHDVGRVAITTSIWDKAEPLTDAERERIRTHSYVGERVLARAGELAAVAEIASAAHERLDGAGYHRRLPASACSVPARLLAAADVYQALLETRPHRAAFSADAAAAELGAMAKAGGLCPDAVGAVLASAGHARRAPERIAGLTDREVEVLRVLARGLTNKEIANALDISVKTAGHHVQHILEKLGVTTRAAATMIAMRRGLVG